MRGGREEGRRGHRGDDEDEGGARVGGGVKKKKIGRLQLREAQRKKSPASTDSRAPHTFKVDCHCCHGNQIGAWLQATCSFFFVCFLFFKEVESGLGYNSDRLHDLNVTEMWSQRRAEQVSWPLSTALRRLSR